MGHINYETCGVCDARMTTSCGVVVGVISCGTYTTLCTDACCQKFKRAVDTLGASTSLQVGDLAAVTNVILGKLGLSEARNSSFAKVLSDVAKSHNKGQGLVALSNARKDFIKKFVQGAKVKAPWPNRGMLDAVILKKSDKPQGFYVVQYQDTPLNYHGRTCSSSRRRCATTKGPRQQVLRLRVLVLARRGGMGATRRWPSPRQPP